MHRARNAATAVVAVLILAPGLGALTPAPRAYADPTPNAPTNAPSAQTSVPTELTVTMERPDWRVRERAVATGRLIANGQPVPDAPIKLGIDGDMDSHPYRVTTGPDGSWRFEFVVEESWGISEHGLYAQFEGDGSRAGASTRTPFQVLPDQASPTVLTVNPVPDPVAPGQQVTLSGSLRRDDNQPAVRIQIQVLIDPGAGVREFTNTDEQGAWHATITVPRYAGEWSREFPRYPVVVSNGDDYSLVPVRQDVPLTLSQPPPPAPAAVPTPTPTPASTPTTAPAAAAPPARTQDPSPVVSQRTVGAMLLPAWLVNPATGVAVGGVLSSLIGAALLSHGRRRT